MMLIPQPAKDNRSTVARISHSMHALESHPHEPNNEMTTLCFDILWYAFIPSYKMAYDSKEFTTTVWTRTHIQRNSDHVENQLKTGKVWTELEV